MPRKSNAQKAAEQAEADAKFNAAVAQAAADKVAEMLPGLTENITSALAAHRPAGQPPLSGDRSFADGLALAIANLSSQGTGKQALVPPEIMEKRAAARDRMMALLVKCKADNVMPVYRVIKQTYLNDTQIFPEYFDAVSKTMQATEIDWDEAPNMAMQPMNDAALAIFTEMLAWVDERPIDRNGASTWVRSDKRLFRRTGSEEGAASMQGHNDPRRQGHGAPTQGRHKHVLGTVVPPAVMNG